MNVGEFGLTFNMNVAFDISGYSTLALTFVRQDGTILIAMSPQVSVGSVPLVTPSGTFAANQYVVYTFAAGNLASAGTYSVRLTYNDATKRLISDVTTFTINP